MSNDSKDILPCDPPSPDELQELIDALKTACSDVASARDLMTAQCQAEVNRFRDEAERTRNSFITTSDEQMRNMLRDADAKVQRLAGLEQQAEALLERLNNKLSEANNLRSRVEAQFDEITSVIRTARTDREEWKEQTRRKDEKNEAALRELRGALAAEKGRRSELEASNKQMQQVIGALGQRLDVQENKKLFGVF